MTNKRKHKGTLMKKMRNENQQEKQIERKKNREAKGNKGGNNKTDKNYGN